MSDIEQGDNPDRHKYAGFMDQFKGQAINSSDSKAREALADRITAYLAGGGLFNPELADHTAVRDLLIDCRDALQWAASQQAAEGWRPIESAPKDGTRFLASDGRYFEVLNCPPRHRMGVWVFINGAWAGACVTHIDPTHWRPLPSPPSTQGGADA